MIRSSIEPNKFVEGYINLDDKTKRLLYNDYAYDALPKIMALDTKIDWLSSNLAQVVNEISRKESRIKELLKFWEGGPVFMSKEEENQRVRPAVMSVAQL